MSSVRFAPTGSKPSRCDNLRSMKGSGLANGAETRAQGAKARGRDHEGLTRDELLAAYRLMLLSRRVDDKEILLKNQQKAFFQISGAGHEAVLVAAGLQLHPGEDWLFPYYRDRALCLTLGVTPLEMFLASVGSSEDPGQRRPPDAVALGPPPLQHAVEEQLRRHAVSARRRLRRGGADLRTSHGHRGPRYALSPGRGDLRLDRRGRHERRRILGIAQHGVSAQAAGRLSGRRQRLRDLGSRGRADGRRRHLACRRRLPRPARLPLRRHRLPRQLPHDARGGRRHAREGKGPVLVHATVTRPYSHSFSDDERLYKTPGEREAEARRDPLRRMQQFLKTEGLATDQDLADIARLGRSRGQPGGRRSATGAQARSSHRRRLRLLARHRSHRRPSSRPSRSHRASPTRWSPPSTRR